MNICVQLAANKDRGDPCGRFYPGFKEAPHASQAVFEGIASREGGESVPHDGVKQDHGGISGAPRGVGETREDRGAPGSRRLVWPDTGMQAHGYGWSAIPCRTTIVRETSCPSAGIDQGPGGGPHPHDDAHRGATGWTAGRARGRRGARGRLAIARVYLLHHQADGRGRDGTAGMEKAALPDFHPAIGEDVREEPAEKFHDVEGRGAWAGTAHCAGSEGDRAVRERDDTLVGDGNLADRRGEGGEGGVAVVMRLTVDVPGENPDLGVARLAEPGRAHLFCEERTGDGRERFDRDKEVRSGRAPGGAILGEATARDQRVDGGDWSCRPQECRTPVTPGRSVPMQRSSWASRLRAVADACNRAWYARRCWERRQGRSGSGTVKGRRQYDPGSCLARWRWRHWGVFCGWHWGQWRLPQA
jgi:hypothetical protein